LAPAFPTRGPRSRSTKPSVIRRDFREYTRALLAAPEPAPADTVATPVIATRDIAEVGGPPSFGNETVDV
jgi:hypothetical protein